jgi:spore germination protein KC
VIEESLTPIEDDKLEIYGQVAAEESKKRVESLLQKFQKEGVDPFGFGLRYRATRVGSEEDKWQEWKEMYPNVIFDVTVKTEIKGTGIIE